MKEKEQFTYGDYATWPQDERWELIKGTPYAMTAPSRVHQEVLLEITVQIKTFLKENNKNCRIYIAPFDVRLAEAEETEDEDISTVVQPDILVVCDTEKLDRKGMRGAPDFIIEILSPSTAGKDNITKLALYEKHGVKEYWIVHPVEQLVRVYLLGEDGKYSADQCYLKTDAVSVKTLPGLTIALDEVFEEETEFI